MSPQGLGKGHGHSLQGQEPGRGIGPHAGPTELNVRSVGESQGGDPPLMWRGLDKCHPQKQEGTG